MKYYSTKGDDFVDETKVKFYSAICGIFESSAHFLRILN